MKKYILLILLTCVGLVFAQLKKGDYKTFNNASATNTVINENPGSNPRNFELYQNHPNPFNPSTLIKYDLPKEAHVSLRVYNLLGQEVAILVNQNQKQGSYSVRFDASHLVNGFYIYRLQTNDFVKVRKMLYLK